VPSLTVGLIDGKGRCLFANEDIAKGSPVATDCVLLVPHDHFEQVGPPLACYPFAWTDGTDAIALGLVSIANHDAENPNCVTERNFGAQMIRLVASRDIEAGEEITYDYKLPSLWFTPRPPSRLNLKQKDTIHGTSSESAPR
jgi:hypothetical protein